MVSLVFAAFSIAAAVDFPVTAPVFFFSAASARVASNGSRRDDASSCRARMDARRDADWISPSSCSLAGFSPALSRRNSVFI
jgi:hypothetical protein